MQGAKMWQDMVCKLGGNVHQQYLWFDIFTNVRIIYYAVWGRLTLWMIEHWSPRIKTDNGIEAWICFWILVLSIIYFTQKHIWKLVEVCQVLLLMEKSGISQQDAYEWVQSVKMVKYILNPRISYENLHWKYNRKM